MRSFFRWFDNLREPFRFFVFAAIMLVFYVIPAALGGWWAFAGITVLAMLAMMAISGFRR